MPKVSLVVDIDIEDLVQSLVNDLDYDQLLEFIKSLDLTVADWDFTMMLYEHFKELKEEFDEESKEIEDANNESV